MMPQRLTDRRTIDMDAKHFTPAQLALIKAARRIVLTLLHLLDQLIAGDE